MPASDTPLALAPLLLTADEAAAMCAVGRSKWFSMMRTGGAPAPIRTLGKRCPRWRRDELERWVSAGCPRPREGGRP